MWVIVEALTAVVQERHERVRGLSALLRDALAVQVGADRLAVAAQMPGDRRDRPPPTQRVRIASSYHVSTQSSEEA
ncbi:hypothetical protein ADL34_06780 [Streptomyces sp. NRRL WC-3605]|nr:hypothetical protein ADL33_29650 [Streptomyces sp. NRRL WC-3604]KUL78898.1 hypothetical protein ADL34_06780 [Streptomyces sp. NRRL WC-3605]